MNTVLCYEKCSTCKKALKWLDDNNIQYYNRPIKEENPTKKELMKWQKESGLELKKFFNTSGILYKKYNLKEKLLTLTQEEQLDLLSRDGMLVKRPLLVTSKGVCPGFKEEIWKELLQ